MISMIFAMDPQKLLGKGNELPWNYPEDLKYFKAKTLHKTVLMGLETFQSILDRNGKPLPNRNSVVASLTPFAYAGVTVINDLFSYLNMPHEEEIFVIGGRTIYQLSLPFADRLYITQIKKVHEGNVYFDKLDLSKFQLVSVDDREELSYCIYERVKP